MSSIWFLFLILFLSDWKKMKNCFTERLRELITESGKMQKDISADLHISKQRLTRWKTGYNEPSMDELIMLALYFDVSSDYLLGLEDETCLSSRSPKS